MITFADLKNGDIVRYKISNIAGKFPNNWSEKSYLVFDKSLGRTGQVMCLEDFYKGYFHPSDNTIFCIIDHIDLDSIKL